MYRVNVGVDTVIRDTGLCYGNEAFAPEKVTKEHELLTRVKYSSEGQTGCVLLSPLTHTHKHVHMDLIVLLLKN